MKRTNREILDLPGLICVILRGSYFKKNCIPQEKKLNSCIYPLLIMLLLLLCLSTCLNVLFSSLNENFDC